MFGNMLDSSPNMSTRCSDALCRFKALPLPFDDLDDSMMTVLPEYTQIKSRHSHVGIYSSLSGYDSLESSPNWSPDSPSSLTVCHKTPRVSRSSHRPRRSLFSSESINDSLVRSRSTATQIERGNVSRDYKQKMASGSVTCLSVSEANDSGALIKSVLDNDAEDTIGDFSKPYCLPTIPGNHSDLKSISVQTVSHLLNGQFSDTIGDFTIIDCRYPYEYNGGHIQNATNIWNRDQLREFYSSYLSQEPTANNKRRIIVFHCEFSSERGPKMSRFLRQLDRDSHKDTYPALSFPEVYLLHKGYKAMYEQFTSLCQPQAYQDMADPDYVNELKYFRAKSKGFNGAKSRICRRVQLATPTYS